MLFPSSDQLTFTSRGLNPEAVQLAVSKVGSTTGVARVTCGTVGRTEMDYNHTHSGWIARWLDNKGLYNLISKHIDPLLAIIPIICLSKQLFTVRI